MRMNILCTVIAAWLNTSQRSHVDVGMNRSAKRLSGESTLSIPTDWILRCIKNIPKTFETNGHFHLQVSQNTCCFPSSNSDLNC